MLGKNIVSFWLDGNSCSYSIIYRMTVYLGSHSQVNISGSWKGLARYVRGASPVISHRTMRPFRLRRGRQGKVGLLSGGGPKSAIFFTKQLLFA